jgi:hypothetical protein
VFSCELNSVDKNNPVERASVERIQMVSRRGGYCHELLSFGAKILVETSKVPSADRFVLMYFRSIFVLYS